MASWSCGRLPVGSDLVSVELGFNLVKLSSVSSAMPGGLFEPGGVGTVMFIFWKGNVETIGAQGTLKNVFHLSMCSL